MANSPKLENYLARLHTALGSIAMSDRAEIVTEMKSHVLDSLERDPSQSIEAVLTSLGEPETVANRYLVERGLKPVKPPKSPIVKWLTIGFLGTFGIFAAMILVLVFKFTPLIKISDKDQRVVILGGMIDIDGKKGTVNIGNSSLRNGFNVKGGEIFGGKRKRSHGSAPTKVSVLFSNGQVRVEPSATEEIEFNCEYKGDQPSITEEGNLVRYHLEKTNGAQCEFKVPADLAVEVKGENGQISFAADSKKLYRYNLSVRHGSMDDFVSSPDPKAAEVSLALENGQILKE